MNGSTRAIFLTVTGAVLFLLMAPRLKLSRMAPLILIFVAWLDVFTHEPTQNPTVPPNIYESNLARTKLGMNPQPVLGESRVMIAPAAFLSSVHTAVRSPKNEFLVNRLGYTADCNLLDDVPKVDGFFSLLPREAGGLSDLLYGSINANFPHLEDFMSVSQITTQTNFYEWCARSTFLPLVTAGQKPIFLDRTDTLNKLQQSNFDGSKIVFLPIQIKSFVTVTNQTVAHILNSHFENERVEIEAQSDETSIVVISQTYYHNWRAFVDGAPTPLIRANYAFQAVQIPAGRHRVELIYEDRAFEIGAAISLSTFLCCLICLPIFKNKLRTV